VSATLLPLLDSRRVIVCAGAGGVGKTTVAAALALAATVRGRRVLCLTIDPARRLADSLGLGKLTGDRYDVQPERLARAGLPTNGRLTVMQLDTKITFDGLVERLASSPQVRDRLLGSTIYRYVSTLAGTQSYMAMEKLLEVKDDPSFDLVVLDTPPTADALDFLDAPARLIDALDSAAMRWFVTAFAQSRKLSLNILTKSVSVVLRGIGRLTGGRFLEQMAEFITDLDDLFGGFRQRATRVADAFRSSQFGYVLVTSPAPMAVREAEYFAESLIAQSMRVDGIVVNRVHTQPPDLTLAEIRSAVSACLPDLGPGAPELLQRAISEERTMARLDAENLQDLAHAITARAFGASPPRIDVPAMESGAHDLPALAGIARFLCPE
jgi:anion-transporting  ArsA/GET3 family ATPase